MSKELTDKVAFDFIRYANCWEDADILLKALDVPAGSRLLSIGSAGDNSFSLLCKNPELVVAVDVSKPQLKLIALKKKAIEILEYEEFLQFLGFHESASRKAVFEKIKTELDSEVREYWEKHLIQLENGLIHQGKFEHYFQLFSGKILPWIHSRKTTEKLLTPKSAQEQADFYTKHWNNWRWRMLFKIFFSKYIMGKYGRDPEFLKEVEVSVGKFIFDKAAHHLSSESATDNFMLRYNLTGSFGTLLPHYLQEENFKRIKERIKSLEIFEGYAQAAHERFGNFDAMNLSNIFEYMNPELFRETGDSLIKMLNPKGKIAYWNLMVPRKLSTLFPEELHYEDTISKVLTAKDKGFFYNQFITETKK